MRLGLAATERLQAEAQARSALAHEPKLLARFEKLPSHCTALRSNSRGAGRLLHARLAGDAACSAAPGWDTDGAWCPAHCGRRVLPDARRTPGGPELKAQPAGSLAPGVMERRKLWQRQRRLTPPLVLGEMTPMMKRIFESSENLLRPEGEADSRKWTGPDYQPAPAGQADRPV